MINYKEGEEFNYCYSSYLMPIQVLYTYGFVVPENPFA